MKVFAEVFEKLEDYVAKRMQLSATPAMAIALFDKQQIHHMSYGFADLEAREALTSEHLFVIGSITKSFTALAIVQAAERGLIDFHAPVTDYLDWFEVQSNYEPITVHHLLTHTAGLVSIVDQTPDVRSAVWALRDTAVAWQPATQWFYSDAGYQILTLILEAVYQDSYHNIIQNNIFAPLQMRASSPTTRQSIRPRMTKGYRHLYDDRPGHASYPLVPAPWIETSSGDSCIASTIRDMAKYGQMLLNQGMGATERLISEDSFTRLVAEYAHFGWGSYAYGLVRLQFEDLPHIWHGGDVPGYEADLLLDTQHGLGVIVLSSKPAINEISRPVMSLLRRAYLEQSLDAVNLPVPDSTFIKNAQDYAGVYQGSMGTLSFVAQDERLFLQQEGQQIALEKRDDDCFYAAHPDFDLFLFQFGRQTTNDGHSRVVELVHGASWYTNEHYLGATQFDFPKEWKAYTGHYRSHIPWDTNFRVLLRKGQLWLIWPHGDEQLLTALDERGFRIGDAISPDRITFDQLMNGQALRARLSIGDYYRFFTP